MKSCPQITQMFADSILRWILQAAVFRKGAVAREWYEAFSRRLQKVSANGRCAPKTRGLGEWSSLWLITSNVPFDPAGRVRANIRGRFGETSLSGAV